MMADMTEADWSLLILVALFGLAVESIWRPVFRRGIYQTLRDRRMIRRAEKVIREAEQVMEEAKRR